MAVEVENISKYYRIGLENKNDQDSLLASIFGFIKSPISNYKRYRSLYKFDDFESDAQDVISALKNVSFKVKVGESVGFIGRNGAGKSTLLKIITRITHPSEGQAVIRGRVSSLLEVGTGFNPELTGKDNIYLNGAVLGMRKKEIDQKFEEIVDFSGIRKFIHTPVKRYSSGMKVRLAFSVAAHLDPEILIVDEVLAVGDADFQKKCLSKMEDKREKGKTVLFVSHNMPAVTRLCSRAIHIDEGKIVNDGSSSQVVSAYLSEGSGTSASRRWRDENTAPGDSVVRLCGVCVRNAEDAISESIDIRRPLTIEMEYNIYEGGHIFLPHFGLMNENGDTVFISVDVDPIWRRKRRSPGKYFSKARIPGNLLNEGILYVNCHMLSLEPDVLHFSEKSVVSFTIIDSLDGDSARGEYSKNISGIVRPLLKWETDYIAN